jgi:hypothetical protein
MNGARIMGQEGVIGESSASDLKSALLILIMACFEVHSRTESGETDSLVPYDAVYCNRVSIRQLVFIFFFLTTCFDPYGPSSGEIYN